MRRVLRRLLLSGGGLGVHCMRRERLLGGRLYPLYAMSGGLLVDGGLVGVRCGGWLL